MLSFTVNDSGFEYTFPFLPVNSVYQPASYRSECSHLQDYRCQRVARRYLNFFEVFNIRNSRSRRA
jgi:hypothetical protein